jgi:hypothetical protein
LTPHPSEGFTEALRRSFDLDVGTLETVNDLIQWHFPRSQFPNSVTILRNGSVLGLRDPLFEIPPDSSWMAQHSAPPTDSAYRFPFPDGHSEEVCDIFDRTVFDLKCHLLEKCGLTDHLPNVLKLEFWSLELPNVELFGSFGLPANADITTS